MWLADGDSLMCYIPQNLAMNCNHFLHGDIGLLRILKAIDSNGHGRMKMKKMNQFIMIERLRNLMHYPNLDCPVFKVLFSMM